MRIRVVESQPAVETDDFYTVLSVQNDLGREVYIMLREPYVASRVAVALRELAERIDKDRL